MKTAELSELLQLEDPAAIVDLVGKNPSLLRWFVDPQKRLAIAERLGDTTLRELWKRPLEIVNQPGHFLVPTVLQQSERWNLAAKAFLLPLKWIENPIASSVPDPLSQLGDHIVAELQLSKRLSEQLHTRNQHSRIESHWGIAWSSDDWLNVDFKDLQLSPESAWAPMAIGLVSAILGESLAPTILATGFWCESEGRWEVGGKTLNHKLQVGYDSGMRTFALPAASTDAARGYFNVLGVRDATVIALNDDPSDAYSRVIPALLQAGVEPDQTASREDKVAWYLSRPTNIKGDDYYRQNLLEEIASERRNELAKFHLENWQPDHLISIISNSDVLIPLATLVFRPKHIHLIHTPDTAAFKGMGKRYNAIKDWLSASKSRLPFLENVHIEEPIILGDELTALPQFVQTLSSLSRPTMDNHVLVDATPGKRAMQLAMMQGARRGDRILCWWHDTHPATRRPLPFSEKMLLWEVAVDGALVRLNQTTFG